MYRRLRRHLRLRQRRGALTYQCITGPARTAALVPKGIQAGGLLVTWRSLHRAALVLTIYRYCDRERTWCAGHATSALLGLIWTLMRPELRRVRARTGAYRVYRRAPRFWFAGVNDHPTDVDILARAEARCVLCCHPEVAGRRQWRQRMLAAEFLVALDSGGFQSWQRGQPLDLEGWAAFVTEHSGLLVWYAQPDQPGAGPDVNRDLLLWAESLGLTPWPVYHVDMPVEYLEWLLNRGYPVIAIGGHVGLPPEYRRRLIREIRTRIRTAACEHVLGAVDPEAWSSDSSNWLSGRRNGYVLTDLGPRRFQVRMDWPAATAANVRYLVRLEKRLAGGTIQASLPIECGGAEPGANRK